MRVEWRPRMTTTELLDSRRKPVLETASRHGETSIRVFGLVARGEKADKSDIGLLVTTGPNFSAWGDRPKSSAAAISTQPWDAKARFLRLSMAVLPTRTGLHHLAAQLAGPGPMPVTAPAAAVTAFASRRRLLPILLSPSRLPGRTLRPSAPLVRRCAHCVAVHKTRRGRHDVT